MTSLICWTGVDTHGPASLYLASDSRISWGEHEGWDLGRKVFAARTQPELLGYCGDVVFPSLFLGQLVELIDAGTLVEGCATQEDKVAKVVDLMGQALSGYPSSRRESFTVLYASRSNAGMQSGFHIFQISWTKGAAPTPNWKALPLPSCSGVLAAFGSGASLFEKWNGRWQRTRQGRTSRSVFGAFCDSLNAGEDSRCGGAPQLVGVYRRGVAETFGVVFRGQRYLLGLPATELTPHDHLEWRNELFERCDPMTLKPLPGAQRHSRPRGLGFSHPNAIVQGRFARTLRRNPAGDSE